MMRQEHWKLLNETFRAAVSAPPADRPEVVRRLTRNMPELRRDLESLLAHHDEAGEDYLQLPLHRALSATADYHAERQRIAPDRHPDPAARSSETALPEIEGYEILGEVHRGGQGVIYQARQVSTKRDVAIKVPLDGPFVSDQSRRRFEREIELVAAMRHPNIVCVFDSGICAGKRWYAMDFVQGRPLDKYVAEEHMGRRDTLRLFKKVCEAVTYAHQRGVMHRDLKPNNILVGMHGEPHVLDFGLAKFDPSNSEHNDASVLKSLTGQVVGTLPYMSPEQATGDSNRIDIRTDVYSLGVILYQLLTGHYPYDVTGPLSEIVNNIVKMDPRRPSELKPGFDRDLEAILMKTLTKSPKGRYASAAELAEDIRRYLNAEPVTARRYSLVNLLARQFKRNKLKVGVGAAFMTLIVALGISMYFVKSLAAQQYQQQYRAEQRENAALEAASAATSGVLTYGRGPGYGAIGRQALDDLEHANESSPASSMIATLRSRMLGMFGDKDSLKTRKRILDRVLASEDPDAAAFWDERAEVELLFNHWDEAEVANERLHDISPNSLEYWPRKTLIHIVRREFDEARSAAISGLKSNSDRPELWWGLCYSLIEQARFDDVIFLLSPYDDDDKDEYDIASIAENVSSDILALGEIVTKKHIPHWDRGHWLLARAICARQTDDANSYKMVLALTPTFMPQQFEPNYLKRLTNLERQRRDRIHPGADPIVYPSDTLGRITKQWHDERFPTREDYEANPFQLYERAPMNRKIEFERVQEPGSALSPTTWCLVHLRLGNLEVAVAGLRKSIEYQGETPIDHLLLCIAYRHLGRSNAAEVELQLAEDLIGDRDTSGTELGTFLQEARGAVH